MVAVVGFVLIGALAVAGFVLRRAVAPLAGDPEGAKACGVLDQWLRDDRRAAEADVVAEAAPHAVAARSADIRALAGHADALNPDGTCCYPVPFVDLRGLHAACRGAGVDLPPY